MPTIITIANLKGGAAKTTTTMLIAASLNHRGNKVAVLDADPTGGATRWSMLAQQAGMPLDYPVTPINQLQLDRDWLTGQYADRDWLLIDTPPADSLTIRKATEAADVTVIPTQPSTLDLTQAGDAYTTAPNGIILLTRVKNRTIVTNNAIAFFDKADLRRFEQPISEREQIKRLAGTPGTDRQYDDVTQELIDYIKQMRSAQQ